ncbi:MAG: LysR family transcriptional regulator [Alphaproteobacteria bacterium]|nr:LysR family transcriptional regulator [Alphaproteobacteria bacterium]
MTAKTQAEAPARREGSITLSALRAFAAVAETRSFSEASRLLGVTQPSVSVQLAALESACGILLCHRKPQIGLTKAGEELFVRARLILSRVAEFDASVRDLGALKRGRLSIGLSAPYLAMALIAAFTQRYPGVRLATEIGNTATLSDDVSRCRIDIGIMTLMEPPLHLACTLIAAPRLAICVRRDDPLAGRGAVRAAELGAHDFVMREEGSLTRAALEQAFAADRVPLRVRLVLRSREAMKEAVAAGLGIGALFEGEEGQDARLVAVPFVAVPVVTGVYAVTLKESLDIPAVRAFVDLIPAVSASLVASR